LKRDGLRALVEAARREGVRDPRVLRAVGSIDRTLFVPAAWARHAHEDRPIPIPHGQVTTQPSLVARMLEGLALGGPERVLEVGTGFGYQTALLSRLAAHVFSIERFADLAEQARVNLRAAGIAGPTIVVGDGTLGLADRAPYDAIVVSAAAPLVPGPLLEQLAEGGRLVHPVGPGGMDDVTAFRKVTGRLVREGPVTPAHFVPLVGRYGLPDRT
jgi:protein-L-isoaspartate(D-aspartate) O-methyltransferase